MSPRIVSTVRAFLFQMQLICHIFGETNYFIVEEGNINGNPYSIRATVGRPRHYKSLMELAQRCDDYFEYIKGENTEETIVTAEGVTERRKKYREPEPATINGLALFLGFGSRQSLYDYVKRGDEFSYIANVALSMVEMKYEQRLSGTAPTGAIFALKNMNWKDKTEQELSGNMGIVWNETKTYDQPAPPPLPGNLLTKTGTGDSEP